MNSKYRNYYVKKINYQYSKVHIGNMGCAASSKPVSSAVHHCGCVVEWPQCRAVSDWLLLPRTDFINVLVFSLSFQTITLSSSVIVQVNNGHSATSLRCVTVFLDTLCDLPCFSPSLVLLWEREEETPPGEETCICRLTSIQKLKTSSTIVCVEHSSMNSVKHMQIFTCRWQTISFTHQIKRCCSNFTTKRSTFPKFRAMWVMALCVRV